MATVTPEKTMNLWSVSALGIGAMVGAGVFAVMGQVAVVAGNNTYIAFIIGGLIAALSGYSYAILAVHFPEDGGLTAYFDRAFGSGRISGTLSLVYMLTVAVTIALVAKAFGGYAAPLLTGQTDVLAVNLFATSIVVVLAVLNIFGTGLVGRAEIVLVAIKLIILAGLIIAGSIGIAGRPAVAELHTGLTGIIGCVGLTFLAYAGYENTANAANSVLKPRQTIPLAMCLAIGAVIILYVGLAIVIVKSAPADEIASHSATIVADAARPVLGKAGYVIMSVGALLATASGINAWIYNGMNISLSLAKARQLPAMFGHQIWRNGTIGILVSLACILLALNLLDVGTLASLTSSAFLFVYLAVYVAHWRLIGQTKANRALVIIGFTTMAIIFLGFLWTMARTHPRSAASIAVILVAAWLIESLLMRKRLAVSPKAS